MKLIFLLSIFYLATVSTSSMKVTYASDPPIDHELPYARIPEVPEAYSACNVAARVIDGLGFRYYWATEGLRESDLSYKSSENARTTAQTIDHIFGLSGVILNAMQHKANLREESKDLTFAEIRRETLQNLKTASDLLKTAPDGDIENFKVIFGEGENSSEFPFWNLLNGPIADAIYHTGQVVSFRRTSGNPINPKVRVFTGSVSE